MNMGGEKHCFLSGVKQRVAGGVSISLKGGARGAPPNVNLGELGVKTTGAGSQNQHRTMTQVAYLQMFIKLGHKWPYLQMGIKLGIIFEKLSHLRVWRFS